MDISAGSVPPGLSRPIGSFVKLFSPLQANCGKIVKIVGIKNIKSVKNIIDASSQLYDDLAYTFFMINMNSEVKYQITTPYLQCDAIR